MELLGAIVKASSEAVRKAREDFIREREAMQGGAAAAPSDANLSEEEQLQMALAMSENELLEHSRQERELDEAANSFEQLIGDSYDDDDASLTRRGGRTEARARSSGFFEGKIADTSDLRRSSDEMDTITDELLARQLQEEEEADDDAVAVDDDLAATATAPPQSALTSAPRSIYPAPSAPSRFAVEHQQHQQPPPRWWSPPPAGPLPIVTSSPPLPWLRDPIPPSPGPRQFFGGLTDSQLAREIQAEEDDATLAANEQPAQYRPPTIPVADSQSGSGNMDDGLMRAMEESRRDAEEYERRALREQQEREYQETLLMDQIRESEREEEEKRKRRQEEEEQRRLLEAEERKEEEVAETEAKLFSLELKRDSEIARLRQAVPLEVTPEQEKAAKAVGRKVCLLGIRLANGSRLERRFWGDNTLLDVKNFVDLRLLEAAKQEDQERRVNSKRAAAAAAGRDSKGEESQSEEDDQESSQREEVRMERYLPRDYALSTTYPQKKFTNWNETLEEAGLCPRALVCVQDL